MQPIHGPGIADLAQALSGIWLACSSNSGRVEFLIKTFTSLSCNGHSYRAMIFVTLIIP